jgi:hypothetical protein
VAAIEVETAAEIVAAAAVGRVAAAVVVDAGDVAVEAAEAGTAVVMADTAEDGTSRTSGPINQHHGAATSVAALFVLCTPRGFFREPTLKGA